MLLATASSVFGMSALFLHPPSCFPDMPLASQLFSAGELERFYMINAEYELDTDDPRLEFRADDLIVEENEDVLKALKRLPPQESYDRVYRLRRAMQCSVTHKLLPKDQWTKAEEVSLPPQIIESQMAQRYVYVCWEEVPRRLLNEKL